MYFDALHTHAHSTTDATSSIGESKYCKQALPTAAAPQPGLQPLGTRRRYFLQWTKKQPHPTFHLTEIGQQLPGTSLR
jgi:hypothetical protein